MFDSEVKMFFSSCGYFLVHFFYERVQKDLMHVAASRRDWAAAMFWARPSSPPAWVRTPRAPGHHRCCRRIPHGGRAHIHRWAAGNPSHLATRFVTNVRFTVVIVPIHAGEGRRPRAGSSPPLWTSSTMQGGRHDAYALSSKLVESTED